jgi:hypothetical protein
MFSVHATEFSDEWEVLLKDSQVREAKVRVERL